MPFSFIFSNLSNRCQLTCINSTKLDKNLINHGAPKGSVLGSIVFLLDINDLPKASNLKTLLFADNTALLVSSDDSILSEKLVNIELKKIKNWLLKEYDSFLKRYNVINITKMTKSFYLQHKRLNK